MEYYGNYPHIIILRKFNASRKDKPMNMQSERNSVRIAGAICNKSHREKRLRTELLCFFTLLVPPFAAMLAVMLRSPSA